MKQGCNIFSGGSRGFKGKSDDFLTPVDFMCEVSKNLKRSQLLVKKAQLVPLE